MVSGRGCEGGTEAEAGGCSTKGPSGAGCDGGTEAGGSTKGTSGAGCDGGTEAEAGGSNKGTL
eukprot:13973537-Alexandrium_andersonii.AAC.1